MPKVLATVVTYHPEPETAANLKILLEQVDCVVVVDNASSSESKALIESVKSPNLILISNPENRGVATAFNQGLKWGMTQDFDYFLLMDQDSQATPDMVSLLLRASVQLASKNHLVMVGPHHIPFDTVRRLPHEDLGLRSSTLLITSGSFFSRALIEVIGYYDETLFIDHVDHDFCIRIKRAGGALFVVGAAILWHRFGQGRVKKFFGKRLIVTDYSPFRRYFMMRNRVILSKRYSPLFAKWFWVELRFAIKDLIKLLLFEKNKAEKLSSALRGFWDGLFWTERSDLTEKVGQ